MAIRKIKKSWWIDIRHNRQRYRIKSPENSKSGAEAYQAVLRQKLARGIPIEFTELDAKQKEREQKFKDFAWTWYETYVKNNNKFSEISRKWYTLRKDLLPFFGEMQIDKITTQHVEDYKAKKAGAGLANKSINNQLAILSVCLHTAQELFDILKIPKIKKLRLPPPKENFLTFEESDLILMHSNGLWRELILTALKTGLRIGELKALNWSDINWPNKTLTVRHTWCEINNKMDTPKNSKMRHIPLTDELFYMLKEKKRVSEAVFVDNTNHNRRFYTKRLNGEIRKACVASGINREITCHTLRHTFASHLAMRGVPIQAIQQLMGHSQIQITMRYAHLSPSTLKDAVALLEPQKQITEYFGQQVGNQPEKALANNQK
ncbi:MAG: site-specific integrase [bacterium]|nr:site-specific integrase [bacterium]